MHTHLYYFPLSLSLSRFGPNSLSFYSVCDHTLLFISVHNHIHWRIALHPVNEHRHCFERCSFHVRVDSGARHRHIPYERPARSPRKRCQPIWAFAVGTAKAQWFLGHRDAGWGKRPWYDIEMVVPYSSTWSSLTFKTVPAKRVDLCSTAALARNTKFQSQPDSICNSEYYFFVF